MTETVNTTVIKVDTSGVEASLRRLESSVTKIRKNLASLGQDAGIAQVGGQAGAAAARVRQSTQEIIGAVQQTTAALDAGSDRSATFYAALGNQRGVNANALQPWLAQLDAAAQKSEQAGAAQRNLQVSSSFLDGLRTQVDAIGKNRLQLAEMKAAQLGVGDAAAPMIAKLREAEEAGNSVFARIGKKVTALGPQLAAEAAVAIASATAGMFKDMVDNFGQLDDMAEKTGASVENLSRIHKVAEAFGTDAGQVDTAITQLSNSMRGIGDGSGKVEEALNALGLSSRDAAGNLRDPAELMVDVATRMQGYSGDAAKAALATDLFGKSGADLLPYLADLATHVGDFQGASAEAVERGVELQENFGMLKVRSEELFQSIAVNVLPAINSLVGGFADVLSNQGDLAAGSSWEWADDLAVGIARAVDFGVLLARTLYAIGQSVRVVMADIKVFASAIDNVNPLTLARKALTGESLLDATKKAIAERNGIITAANTAWENLVNAPTDAFAKAVEKKIAERSKPDAKPAPESAPALHYRSATSKPNRRSAGASTKELPANGASTGLEIPADASEGVADALEATAKTRQEELRKLTEEAVRAAAENQRQIQTFGMTKLEIEQDQLDSLKQELINSESRGASQEMLDALTKAIDAKQVKVDSMNELAQKEAVRAKEKELQEAAAQSAKASEEAAKKAADDWKQTSDKITGSLTSAFTSAFESGKSIGDSLVASLKKMFNELVLTPMIKTIIAPVGSVLTGLVPGLAQASGGESGSGGGSGLSGLGTLGGLGSSLFGAGGLQGALMGGAGWITGATSFTGALSAGASLIGTGSLAGIASGMGMIAGALGPIGLGVATVYSLVKSIDHSGTPHTGGAATSSNGATAVIRAETLNFQKTATSETTEKFVSGVASSIAAILDGTASAFGQKAGYTVSTGFADDSSKDGAWGGLVISKDGKKLLDWQDTRTSRWAPKEFDDGEKGQKQYLAEVSKSVRRTLDDIGLPGWAKQMLDQLGDAPALEDLAKTVDAINNTEKALTLMGERLVGFGDLTDAAVSALMSASGGMEALAANASAYYDAFYTEGEKASVMTSQVADALQKVGLSMPTSRDEFRAQVEAQMKLGEAGAPAVAALLGVAGAFAQLYPAVEHVSEATEKAADTATTAADAFETIRNAADGLFGGVDDAFSVLQKVVDREKGALQTTIDDKSKTVETLRSMSDALHNTLDSLRTPEQQLSDRVSAQAEIRTVLAISKAGGPLPDADKLKKALSAVSQDASDQFSSYSDYLLDLYQTQSDIASLAGITDDSLSIEEKALEAAQAQLKSLDDVLANAQQQIDILKGIDTNGLTLIQAMQGLASAISIAKTNSIVGSSSAINNAYQTYLGRAPDAAGFEWWQNAAASGTPIPQIVDGIAHSTEADLRKLYQSVLGRAPDADGLAFWMNAYGPTMSADEKADFMKAAQAELNAKAAGLQDDFLKTHGVPGYASGGMFGGGLRIVGEHGPELEATGPSRIWSQDQTASILSRAANPIDSSGALIDEIKALRAEVQALREANSAENRAIAKGTQAAAEHLDAAINGDTPLSTKVIPA